MCTEQEKEDKVLKPKNEDASYIPQRDFENKCNDKGKC